MNLKKNFIITTLCIGLTIPAIGYAATKPMYLSLLDKLGQITHFDTIVATKIRDIPYLTDAQPPETIIDTFSGIKITFEPATVYFSYLGENTPPQKITHADPDTFQIIETGTEIIASDKEALYIIYGNELSRITHIDLESLKIIYKGDHGEKKYLKDKHQTYQINGLNLIPVTLSSAR